MLVLIREVNNITFSQDNTWENKIRNVTKEYLKKRKIQDLRYDLKRVKEGIALYFGKRWIFKEL
jgi:hypothetical protein